MKSSVVKNTKIFGCFIILAIIILGLYKFGFRITYSPALENSWAAIDAVGGWIGAIATFLAVIVALYPLSKRKLTMFFVFSPDYNPGNEEFATLVVTNSGNTAIVLKKIVVTVGNHQIGEKLFISDEYWLANADVVYLLPSMTKKIPLLYNELRKDIGHSIDIDNTNKDQNVKITVYDIDNNEYMLKTKHTFQTYRDLLFDKVK